MIKFDSEKETIGLNGTVKDLVYDTVLMIRAVYKSLKKHGYERSAEDYKSFALLCIPDAFLDEEAVKKKAEESHQRGKMLEEMQEMLNTLREMHSNIDPNPEDKEKNSLDEFNKWLYGQESEEE